MGALRFLGAAQSESPFFVRYKIQPMAHQFEVIIERDSEGYFVASVPALPGCHTQAKSMDLLLERIREAIELCLEVDSSPTTPLEFIGVQRITVMA